MLALIKALKNVEGANTDMCYVSNILISEIFPEDSHEYEVSRDAVEFFDQKDKGKNLVGYWSESTYGRVNKAMGSVVNVYDNELKFPQLSTRTVLVRHINIGTNQIISTEIVNNATRIPSNNLTLMADKTVVTGSNTSAIYSGYEEYYESGIDVEKTITKQALVDTESYKCIGHNIEWSSSLRTAQNNIETSIKNNKYNKSTTAVAPGQDIAADSDYIVIDFYYTQYEKDVEVNHIYLNQDGYVIGLDRQTIVPNNTAVMNGENINRVNTDKYIKEVYAKQKGINIQTRIADSLEAQIRDGKVEYLGYEVFENRVNVSSLVGSRKLQEALTSGNTATITSSEAQVNFYYIVEENKEEEPEPEKKIPGKVFVVSNEETQTTCEDDGTGNWLTTSIPSGTKATVGIKDIPRYMLGAVTTKYVSPVESERNMNITMDFTMAGQKKTINIDNIKYRVGYYKITDMAVYKLTRTTIFDAQNGKNGTIGESLFNWKNGRLDTNPEDMDLKVELTGRNGKIKNTPTDIDNIDNYVAVNVVDKNGNKTNYGTTNSTLTREYLSLEQYKEVDADSKDGINEKDKTFADTKLAEYQQTLSSKQQIQTSKQEAYENIVKQQDELYKIFKAAEAELQIKKDAYDEEDAKKSNKLKNIRDLTGELNTLNNTTLPNMQAELEELTKIEEQKLIEKENAEANFIAAEQENKRLNDIYLDSITHRNELAAKAECNDTVNSDIYLQESEKEALEECKQYKEEYQKNLTDKVVENAQAEYENYNQNEYKQAESAQKSAVSAYDSAVLSRENKEEEIETVKITIEQKQALLTILEREYADYIENQYTPIKSAYDSYRDNEYKNASDAYNDYVEAKHAENALNELNNAKEDANDAQAEYDSYKKYRDNLYNKYDDYKLLYDEFMSITESNAASLLGLKLNIYVQNMIAKVNGTEIAKAANNTAVATYNIQELINNNVIPEVKTERPIVDKKVYENIGTTYTLETDYTNSNNIDASKLNGIRVLSGEAEYEAQVIIGNKAVNQIEDTIYYSDQSDEQKTVIFKLKTTKLKQTYKVDLSATTAEEKYEQTEPINIYTPITVSATLTSNENQIIDQTQNLDEKTSVIQLNTAFTINLANNEPEDNYKIDNTNKYSAGYYVKFDFDVHEVSINGKKYNNGNVVRAGTWIGIISKKNNKAYITAKAYGNIEHSGKDMISEEKNTYTVRAIAYNATDIMRNRSTRYDSLDSMTADTSELKNSVYNICTNPSYFAEEEYYLIILNRIYDFRVTDLKDLNWKSVFRKSSSENTNEHKGILYYPGTTKWNTNTEKSNEIISRTTSEIGRSPLRILPLGPYKNTDTTYIKAPKMGYRFSFDLKVTGAYYSNTGNKELNEDDIRTDKKVNINTRFYYISKDGKEYWKEYDGEAKGIYLFYKTSSGKYVKIDQEGGGYSLSFTPNDGYRYIEDASKSTLSEKLETLGNLRKLTLNYKMATVSTNGAIITYYGEYKLPNSTIAVEVEKDGSYDINKPLKNGYIGVVFDIVAYSENMVADGTTKEVQLSYSKDTKESKPNTSQWDYEGFLGYTKYGQMISPDDPLKLKLEHGTWAISNEVYNEIKGSVILYDVDSRAATDYE